MVSFRIHP